MIDFKHNDCLDVLKQIDNESIDLILQDPPYNATNCKWEWDIMTKIDELWNEWNRIIKPNGVIAIFGSEPFSSKLRLSNLKMYKYDWIWEKETHSNFFQAKYCPLTRHENISIFGFFGINSGSKIVSTYNPQNIIEINKTLQDSGYSERKMGVAHKSSFEKGKTYTQKYSNYPQRIIKFNRDKNAIHETQKPIELLEYLIKTYTDENDIVFDGFAGVASTAIACINTNRKFIGCELHKKYFDIGNGRINKHIKVKNND